jgi:hypothetical protein
VSHYPKRWPKVPHYPKRWPRVPHYPKRWPKVPHYPKRWPKVPHYPKRCLRASLIPVCSLEQKIPGEMEIPDLGASLVKLMQDFRIQVN